jgi:hypothetical protein
MTWGWWVRFPCTSAIFFAGSRVETLKGSAELWLINQENPDRAQQLEFHQLQRLNLRNSRAWAIEELFSATWW